jgi:hypothetical protein
MEMPRYCVYNQTNECFLSLGVIAEDQAMAPRDGIVARGRIRSSEGRWLARPARVRTVGLFSSRDLIYLDHAQKVIHSIGRMPVLRMAPVRAEAASVLVMPVSTIESSQTQVGNQLVICGAEEMESRLHNPGAQPGDADDREEYALPADAFSPADLAGDRRFAPYPRWPRLVAFDSECGPADLRGVRDISPTGLYITTSKRWPVGSQVRMSLQRTDGLDDTPMIPITVDLRVSRWGEDGVGLEFVRADIEHSALVATPVH